MFVNVVESCINACHRGSTRFTLCGLRFTYSIFKVIRTWRNKEQRFGHITARW